jgi:hypothetical protein
MSTVPANTMSVKRLYSRYRIARKSRSALGPDSDAYVLGLLDPSINKPNNEEKL